jgi:hypothetical protein
MASVSARPGSRTTRLLSATTFTAIGVIRAAASCAKNATTKAASGSRIRASPGWERLESPSAPTTAPSSADAATSGGPAPKRQAEAAEEVAKARRRSTGP